MSGFKNSELNNTLYNCIFDDIAYKVLICSEKMVNDCIYSGKEIINHEEKIRNHLLENYLNHDEVRVEIGFDKMHLRFIAEVPENYNIKSEVYSGRVDIKVVGLNWLSTNCKDYLTIECKRIDGSTDLNKKFVDNGICRFTTEPILYPSYNNKNIMFGFVVKNIDIDSNAILIDELQNKNTNILIKQGFTQMKSQTNNSNIYLSLYLVKGKVLELKHLFYDFSKIIIQPSSA